MKNILRPALTLFALTSLVTGIIYPLVITGIAQKVFPYQASGSLIKQGNRVVGSSLIGQNFSDPKYFWGRPSATSPIPYDATNSNGSNLGPTNPALVTTVKARVDSIHAAHPGQTAAIPTDLVTASASGIDPHISPAAANYQIERVATARKLPVEKLKALVAQYTAAPQWGLFGEARVNVLELNLALDRVSANG